MRLSVGVAHQLGEVRLGHGQVLSRWHACPTAYDAGLTIGEGVNNVSRFQWRRNHRGFGEDAGIWFLGSVDQLDDQPSFKIFGNDTGMVSSERKTG